MFQNLLSGLSGAPTLPAQWEYLNQNEISFQAGIWDCYDGRNRNDGSKCTIWVCTTASPPGSSGGGGSSSSTAQAAKTKSGEPLRTPNVAAAIPLAQNAVCALKRTRHPCILKVLDSAGEGDGGQEPAAETTKTSQTKVFLVTERVRPLTKEQAAGNVFALFQISKALAFLHQSKRAHNGLDLNCVFLTESSDFRLGGFELCESVDTTNPDVVLTKRRGNHRLREDALLNVFDVAAHYSAREYFDFLGLHAILQHIFGGASQIPPSLRSIVSDLQSTRSNRTFEDNPVKRLTDSAFFKKDRVCRLMVYLEELHLKESSEKVAFFEQTLPSELDQLQLQAAHSNSSPPIFSLIRAPILQAAQFNPELKPTVFPILLKLCELTSSAEEFQEFLQPYILEQFRAPDRAVRYRLLTSMHFFLQKTDAAVVATKIFPEIVNGFTDQNASIREATVKAMVVMAGKLEPAAVQDKVVKQLAARLRDPEPSLRTNTVICFGKIANKMLDPVPVLKQAFATAMNDPFVPCRTAALQALRVSLEYFSLPDIANVLLPAVSQKVGSDQEAAVVDLALERRNDNEAIVHDRGSADPIHFDVFQRVGRVGLFEARRPAGQYGVVVQHDLHGRGYGGGGLLGKLAHGGKTAAACTFNRGEAACTFISAARSGRCRAALPQWRRWVERPQPYTQSKNPVPKSIFSATMSKSNEEEDEDFLAELNGGGVAAGGPGPAAVTSSKHSAKTASSSMFGALEKEKKQPVVIKKETELKKEVEDAFWDDFD
eukprot:g8590.t1